MKAGPRARPALLALTFAVGLAGSGLAVASRRAPDVDEASPGPPLVTPLLSARRIPSVVAQEIADRNLRSRIDSALTDPSYGTASRDSCLLIAQGERQIERLRPEMELIPASNLKLLTATAALTEFGEGHTFATELRAAAPPNDGVVSGDLWLVGGGDPVLMTPDYAASFKNLPQLHTPVSSLGEALAAAGVREVRGDFVGDESRYDRIRYIPTWRSGYIADGEVGPASALLVNDGFTAFLPRKMAASDPAAHAAGLVAAAAEAKGVVLGAVRSGTAPKETVLVARVQSPPLSEIVQSLLRESDNTTAELLLKELGVARRGEGTTAAGLAAMREILAVEGIDSESYVATDGSGLDRGNRASCLSVDRALTAGGPEGVIGQGLAIAAQTGTLSRRFQGTPAAGRLRAKTGALEGVVSLSGWVPPRDGPPIDFTFIANGVPTESRGRQLQERVGVALSLYPEAPAEQDLGPQPAITSGATRE